MPRRPGTPGRPGTPSLLPLLVLLSAALPAALGAQQATRSAAAEDSANQVSIMAGDALIAGVPTQPIVPPAAYRRAVEAGTRSADGRPGPNYWQQRVDYDIDVRLDPAEALITGSETATIHNNSPNSQSFLVVRLYQNVFSEGVERNRTVQFTGGVTITRIAVVGTGGADGADGTDGTGSTELRDLSDDPDAGQDDPGYRIADTRMAITLPQPIAPAAQQAVEIDWSFTVSGGGGFRNGHLDNHVFNIAQWYPQIAVVDDVFGLDTDPYLGDGEFYVDYGDFDVSIDLPVGWVAVGSGRLTNPADVLRDEAARTLETAADLDTVVYVISPADVAAGPARMTRASDSGRALIQGVYDPDATAWAEAAAMGKHAIEFFSDYLLPYPYPTATVAYGPPQVGGMEYPMITFINHRDDPVSLNGTTTHELSHFWVPMIVGTKENAFAWMDEGFTTYNTALALVDYYGDATAEGRTRVGAMNGYLNAARAGAEVPIMRHTDYAENGFGRSIAAYSKPGMLMHALRHMMGEEAFDAAYRDYIATWAYKHPMPWDFFAMMEAAAGTDLDWFWQSWYYGTETMDQAIEAVEVVDGGVRVTVSTTGGAVMPVELGLEIEGGGTLTTTWPVNVWAEGREVTRLIPTDGTVRNVHIDPDAWYPDIDRSNNDWERPGA